MSKTVRIIIIIVGLIIITIGAVLWLRNPDSHILSIAFTVIGVVVSFVPAIWPFSSSGATFSRMEGLPRLIVRADRSIDGQAYLLDSELYANVLDRLHNPETRMQYMNEQNVDSHPVYGAIFRDLVPGQQ
jgi:CBS domain containing-hemolysin-like protein